MLLEAGDRVTGPLRDIAGGSTKAARALGLTRDKLKEIERAQGEIAGFRALKAGLGSTAGDLATARTRMAALRTEIASTDKSTASLTRALAKAEREVASLETSERKQSQSLQELGLRLHTAGIDTEDLARHQRRLRTEAVQTNREIQEQEQRVSRLADRERRMAAGRARFARIQGMATGLAAGGAAAIGTGMAMAAPLIGSIKAAQEYESVMTDIGQKADLSRAASEQLGKNLLVSARAANQMPADLQAGVDALAGLGAKVPDAVKMMTPIGRAATAYKAEISDLSAAAFAATDNLKVPVEQTGKIIDVMASAGKAGAFEIKDMAQYFPSLTAAYQGLGQTGVGAVADLAAGLQIARKGAGDAATAGGNLANILQKISSPATNKAFEKMGVNLPAALKKAYDEGKTPLEAIAELTNKTLKGDLSKLGYLFEDAQVQQGLRPLIQNMEEFRRIRAEASKASGTTDRDFADRMKDSAEQSKQLKINATTLAITLGAQLLPTINAVVVKANAFATWIGDVANRYPNATKAIAIGAAGFAALFLVLGGGAMVIAGLVAPFAALSFAAGALNIAMLPMLGIALGVVAGVVAIGAAAYLIYQNWGAIGGWFAGIWAAMSGAVSRNWTSIRNILLGAVVIFMPMVAGFALLAKGIYDHWDGIKGAFSSGVAYLAGMVMPFVQPVLNVLGLIEGLRARFTAAGLNIVKGIAMGILRGAGWLLSLVGNLAGRIGARFAGALGIHSPSRVFAGYGGNIVDGLTNGIAAQEGEPIKRMDRLSSRLSSSIVSGSAIPSSNASGRGLGASTGGGTSTGGDTYVAHFHPSAGMDERALFGLFERWQAQQQDQKAARSRSAFADRPDWEAV
jgi:TP901 family phage tail tape measure protein